MHIRLPITSHRTRLRPGRLTPNAPIGHARHCVLSRTGTGTVVLLARLARRSVQLAIDPLPNRHRHAPQLEQSHRISSASSCSPISSSARPDNRHRSQPSRTWLPMLATRLALTICRLAISRRLVRMSARLRRANRCRAGPHSCLGLPHLHLPECAALPPRPAGLRHLRGSLSLRPG